MKGKLKIIIRILVIILVTIACICLGFYTRYQKGIIITQFGQVSSSSRVGYLLESDCNSLILIDGGEKEEATHLIDTIKQKGGIVKAWFITVPHKANAEAILEVLNSAEVQVNNIYISLNGLDWYKDFEGENEYQFVSEFMNTLASDSIRDRVHEVNLRDEIAIDNLNFKVLKIKNPEYTENISANQSMILKVSNTFKSMIFLGEFGVEYQKDFFDKNQDEIRANGVQVSYHGESTLNESIYEKIKPKRYFFNTSQDIKVTDSSYEYYSCKDGDITVRIY